MIKNVTNAEHYQWGDQCDGFRLLERADLSVIQERIPPGAGEARHFHHQARQLFYVLKGELHMDLAGNAFRIVAGDSLEVPPGAEHRVWNASDTEASFLVVSAPTTRGDRTNVQ